MVAVPAFNSTAFHTLSNGFCLDTLLLHIFTICVHVYVDYTI